MGNLEKSKAQRWSLLIYLVFCFYYFGTATMTYFVSYAQLQKNNNKHPRLYAFV